MTVYEWLMSQLSPEEGKALTAVLEKERKEHKYRPLLDMERSHMAGVSSAIRSSFMWHRTPQGHEYWAGVANRHEEQSR